MSSNQFPVSNGVGCDFRRSRNQLVLVQSTGKISRLDLTRALDSIVFSGSKVMPPDSSLSLENGTSAQGGEIRWDHLSPMNAPILRPQGNSHFSYLGQADYDSITSDELQDLQYNQSGILGSQLKPNDVIAVWNSFPQPAAPYNCVKIKIASVGANLGIKWVTYALKEPFKVLGTGYNNPRGIVVRSDEQTAYVTEQGPGAQTGNLLRVNLTKADRAFATVVAGSLKMPQQISLDEVHNQAYVVEFANPGRLLKIDLVTGGQNVILDNLEWPNGLLMSKDHQFAYVSEQNGKVSRFSVTSKQREILASGLSNPFFLTWADSSETSILIPEKTANRISLLNLVTVPPNKIVLLNNGPAPSSIGMRSPTYVLICCSTALYGYPLNIGLFNAGAPALMGIGHVPVTSISRTLPVSNPATDGYATTDPGYFFQVKDAPFGGTLAIMINHEEAWKVSKAKFYRLEVDGVAPQQSWSDYKWSSSDHSFVLQNIGPTPAGFYRLRQPWEVWYNHWLGYMLDTSGLTNGLHTITLRLFSSESLASEIGNASLNGRSMVVQIDNKWPQVSIVQILHDGQVINACDTVDKGSHLFTFRIIATDSEQHMLSWSLVALWGDNKSKPVASDSYANHIVPSKKWAGVKPGINDIVPAPAWDAGVAGDPTSLKCAHTFYLGAWDRVINGWGYIHYVDYHKSITLNLP